MSYLDSDDLIRQNIQSQSIESIEMQIVDQQKTPEKANIVVTDEPYNINDGIQVHEASLGVLQHKIDAYEPPQMMDTKPSAEYLQESGNDNYDTPMIAHRKGKRLVPVGKYDSAITLPGSA